MASTAAVAGAAGDKPFVDELWRIDGTVTNSVVPPEELVVLATEGEPRATVVMTADAPSPIEFAAEQIVKHVELTSGAELPIVTDPAEVETEHRIWLGHHEELEERFSDVSFVFEHPEEILVIARPQELAILGRDVEIDGEMREAGTTLAALTFLQDYLGVRWLWPGELGTDVLASAHIAFEPFEHRDHPQVRYRAPRVVNAFTRWRRSRGYDRLLEHVRAPNKVELREEHVGDEDDMRELAHQRDRENRHWLNLQRGNHGGGELSVLSGSLSFRGGHAFGSWYDRFGEEHPEWFALHPDGTRAAEQDDPYPSRGNIKLCISNPEVAEQWLDDAEEYFTANPHATAISVAPNDGGLRGYCVCENCEAWDPDDVPTHIRKLSWRDREMEYPQLSDRYARFWNRLARGLRERFPDRELVIGSWAYHAYRPAPIDVELEPNIKIGYVGIRKRHFPTNNVTEMGSQLEEWKGWYDAGISGVVWRPNSLKRNAGIPYVYLHRNGQNWNTLGENGIVGFTIDSFHHHWATQAPQYYLMVQMMWDPHQDYEAVLEDYFRRAYGPGAAPYVQAYFEVFEQVYAKVAERYGGDPERDRFAWQWYSGLPHAFRELKVHPTLEIDMAAHTWDDFPWDLPGPKYHGEDLARRYLEKAEAAVADGPERYRDRVAFLRVGFDYTATVIDIAHLMNRIRHRDGDRDELLARVAEAAKQRERIMFENIHTPAFGYFQEITQYRYRFHSRLGMPMPEVYENWDEPYEGPY